MMTKALVDKVELMAATGLTEKFIRDWTTDCNGRGAHEGMPFILVTTRDPQFVIADVLAWLKRHFGYGQGYGPDVAAAGRDRPKTMARGTARKLSSDESADQHPAAFAAG